MMKKIMNPAVDFYFNKTSKWQQEIKQLRTIVLDCGLTETLKWGCACYQLEKANIVLIHEFKEYCALLFFKGALLKDANAILVQQTENVQAARQVRFTSLKEIKKQGPALHAYIQEAVAVEKAGLKVPLKKTADFKMPAAFQQQLNKDAALKNAFNALTPGRQRGYLLHFAAAKQAKTLDARIEKARPGILNGKGLND